MLHLLTVYVCVDCDFKCYHLAEAVQHERTKNPHGVYAVPVKIDTLKNPEGTNKIVVRRTLNTG